MIPKWQSNQSFILTGEVLSKVWHVSISKLIRISQPTNKWRKASFLIKHLTLFIFAWMSSHCCTGQLTPLKKNNFETLTQFYPSENTLWWWFCWFLPLKIQCSHLSFILFLSSFRQETRKKSHWKSRNLSVLNQDYVHGGTSQKQCCWSPCLTTILITLSPHTFS